MVSLRDEQGMVGKLAIVWLLLVALIIVGLVDGTSIAITRYHLSTVATNAASDAAADYQLRHDVQGTCDAAVTAVHVADPGAKFAKQGCTVDTATGQVTISLRKIARTLLAGRLSFTKKYVVVTDTETNGPSEV